MPSFDEATLRKAAAWQDFKEAQGLLNTGAVISSESTPDGFQGTLKIGTRTYRTTVVARTPTWFDSKCPCPRNQREGAFCPHAIAVGLHLISPPKPVAAKITPPKHTVTEIQLPEVAWKIRFQGPWQKALEKGQAAICLSSADHSPTPADRRITAWLISQKQISSATIQLALHSQNLSEFLNLARNHPDITCSDGALTIETRTQLRISNCTLSGETIQLTPGADQISKIGGEFWNISPSSIAQIGNGELSPTILPILNTLAAGKPTELDNVSFLQELDKIQVSIDFSASDWFESLQFISAEPKVEITISGGASKLQATFHTSYSQSLPCLDGTRLISRNPQAESHARRLISQYLTPLSDTSYELADPDRIRDFLTREISKLPTTWEVELTPAVQKLASSYVVISPRIEILSSSDQGLDFNLSFHTESGETIPATEIRRLLRSRNSPSNQRIILSDDIENLIDPLFEDLDIQQQNGRFIAKQANAEIIQEISKILRHSTFLNKTENCPQVIHNHELKATLRPYQIDGFSWLVDRLTKFNGALLADDMGLGKTLQTIACIEHFFSTYSQPSPVLIVVTTSLLGNWKAEFNRFAPERRVITLHGPQRDRLRDQIEPTDVILTTYATLSRDLAWQLRQNYSMAVIDEASLIRNPDTDHSKAVAKINATYRIALTGTPVENSARDLWSIFRFVQPGWLSSRKDFQERYEIPLKAPETQARTATLLRLKTSPFTLRRTKTEVAPDLPSKILIDEFCTLSRDQESTYREIQKQGLRLIDEIRSSGQTAAARMQQLTTLLRLRQSCCDLALFDSEKLSALPIPRRSAKLERLLEITESSISAGSRILVFSQFQKQLVEIGKALDEIGIASIRLDGQSRNRQALVDHFQSPEGPPVFLISLKAGGYGLNLTAADIVIHFDPWWNPAAEDQATDRAHRIGQTKPVTVFRLLTRNTVEEKVVRLQNTKKALADSLNESLTPSDAPAWNAAEIEKLISG
jgi:SNF2 family DNA or RNA helicase